MKDFDRISRARASIGMPPKEPDVVIAGERLPNEPCDLTDPHRAHFWEYDGMRLGCPGVRASLAQTIAAGIAVYRYMGVECDDR